MDDFPVGKNLTKSSKSIEIVVLGARLNAQVEICNFLRRFTFPTFDGSVTHRVGVENRPAKNRDFLHLSFAM